MNADEWLKQNGMNPWNLPYQGDNGGPFWYWATYMHYDGPISVEEVDADERHYHLPVAVWNHLQDNTTYPYVKMYWTEAAALEDFRQAYDKARNEGWDG